LWLLPLLWWVSVPSLDNVLPRAAAAPMALRADERGDDPGSTGFMRFLGFALMLDFVAIAWLIAQAELPVHAVFGAGLTLAAVLATDALNVRYLRPSQDPLEVIPAALASGFLGGGFYRRALNVDHQHAAATQGDPFSARMGEGFWKYSYRAAAGLLMLAWRHIQCGGVQRNPARALAANQELHELLFTLLTLAVLVVWAGIGMFAVLTIACSGTLIIVFAAHYVQHYGLLRAKRSDGVHVRPGAAHAWDDAHRASALLLFNASRHAHAHLAPRRDYASLNCLADAPKLPDGLAAAMLLAMVPPAWFVVMDPRVARWAEGDLQRVNSDGDACAALMARYHRPRVKQNERLRSMPCDQSRLSALAVDAIGAERRLIAGAP
jgi:alkane 1-monooxygenase